MIKLFTFYIILAIVIFLLAHIIVTYKTGGGLPSHMQWKASEYCIDGYLKVPIEYCNNGRVSLQEVEKMIKLVE